MKYVITLLFVIGLPLQTHAAGFALNEQGASAAGAGGTGVARDADATAGWYNPAALVDGIGWRAAAGVVALSPRITAEGSSFQTSTELTFKTPPHAYLSYAHKDWMAGVAINVPFGSGVVWPSDWAGQFEATSSSLTVLRASVFGGYRLGRLRVAAGPSIDFASIQSARRIDFVDTTGDVALSLQGLGVGAQVAAYYEASERLALGLTYKSRVRIRAQGDADFDVPDAFTGTAHDQAATSVVNLPDMASAGAAFALTPRLTLLADVGFTAWDVYDELVVDFADEATSDLVRPTQWRSRVNLRVGAEQRFASWVVRTGAFFDPTPAPSSTLVPSSPDSDRLGATLGIQKELGRGLIVQGFYEYVRMLQRTADNDNSLDANYGGFIHVAGVGVQLSR